ncbi:hypothetical protein BRARA_D01980 [Brassica rapa]|uniref:Uncharacterized protein n=1 Tax=Brassica campestris TaxID=3711 RepID=A0A397ZMJ9_BRACM|nr:hypothetical protein BRARA_D01980 [Brassica rapa]
MVKFCTSGKLPVRWLSSRSNLVNEVRLLIVGGTCPENSLEEREKISSLLRFPNSEGSDDLKLLEPR